jgi:hypothetical protein
MARESGPFFEEKSEFMDRYDYKCPFCGGVGENFPCGTSENPKRRFREIKCDVCTHGVRIVSGKCDSCIGGVRIEDEECTLASLAHYNKSTDAEKLKHRRIIGNACRGYSKRSLDEMPRTDLT